MIKYFILGPIVILVVIVGGFLLRDSFIKKTTVPPVATISPATTPSKNSFIFSNPKKSAHYESNTPEHGNILPAEPVNVVIDFNFDLAKQSEIKILKDGVDVGFGETVIDESKLAMRRYINSSTSDGKYKVEYKACWPDGSCHDGYFEFAVDRSKANDFSDQKDKKEVIIKMSEISFKPQKMKVGKGTKITWINDEATGHYVNTDPHPGHSYYPAQNSQLLQKGQSFSLTFERSGFYPYHCSAHATDMVGAILVE